MLKLKFSVEDILRDDTKLVSTSSRQGKITFCFQIQRVRLKQGFLSARMVFTTNG